MSDTAKNTVQYNYFCPLIDEKEALEKRKNCDTANMNFTDKTGKGLLTLFYGHLSTKEPVGPLTVLNKMMRECRLNVHKVVDFLIKHSSFTSPFVSLCILGFRNEPPIMEALKKATKEADDADKGTILDALSFMERNLPERMKRCFAVQLTLDEDKKLPKITLFMDHEKTPEEEEEESDDEEETETKNTLDKRATSGKTISHSSEESPPE